jgi:hypothetical protein
VRQNSRPLSVDLPLGGVGNPVLAQS